MKEVPNNSRLGNGEEPERPPASILFISSKLIILLPSIRQPDAAIQCALTSCERTADKPPKIGCCDAPSASRTNGFCRASAKLSETDPLTSTTYRIQPSAAASRTRLKWRAAAEVAHGGGKSGAAATEERRAVGRHDS